MVITVSPLPRSRKDRIELGRRILAHPFLGAPIMQAAKSVPAGLSPIPMDTYDTFFCAQNLGDVLAAHPEPILYFVPTQGIAEQLGFASPSLPYKEQVYAIHRADAVWLKEEIAQTLQKHTSPNQKADPAAINIYISRESGLNAISQNLGVRSVTSITVGLLAGMGRENIKQIVHHEIGHLADLHTLKSIKRKFPDFLNPFHRTDFAKEQADQHRNEYRADSIGAAEDPIDMAKALSALRKLSFDQLAAMAPPAMAEKIRGNADAVDLAIGRLADHPSCVERVAKLLQVDPMEIAMLRTPNLAPTFSHQAIRDATHVAPPPPTHVKTGSRPKVHLPD